MADNRPPAYLEDGTAVYRISGLSGCPKDLLKYFDTTAEPDRKPPGLTKAAESGEMFEQEAKAELEANGYEIFNDQEEVELKVSGAILRGHTDGCTNHPKTGEVILIECKEMNDERFKLYCKEGLKAFPGYCLQIALYMRALKLHECLYIVGLRGKKSYSIGKTVRMDYIRRDADFLPGFSEVVKKVRMLEKARKAGESGPCDGSSFFCRWRLQNVCEVDKKGEPVKEVIERSMPELEELILKERALAARKKQAEAEHKKVADKIKKLATKGVKIEVGQSLRVQTDNPKVKLSRFYVRRFSNSKAKEKYPEVFEDAECYDQFPQFRFTGKVDE